MVEMAILLLQYPNVFGTEEILILVISSHEDVMMFFYWTV